MATFQQRVSDLATRIATEFKEIRVVTGTLASLTTTAKDSLVNAINELKTSIDGKINDAATNLTQTWSSSKINSQISTAISNLTTGAPTAMDTLDELSAALGDDANFAATITTALGNRVRFDAAQTLTAPQKAPVKSNIDAYGNLEIGNPDTDFVATFNAGLL